MEKGDTIPKCDITPEDFVLFIAAKIPELSQEKAYYQLVDIINMAKAIRDE